MPSSGKESRIIYAWCRVRNMRLDLYAGNTAEMGYDRARTLHREFLSGLLVYLVRGLLCFNLC